MRLVCELTAFEDLSEPQMECLDSKLSTKHTSCEISSAFFDFWFQNQVHFLFFSFPGSPCYKESHGYEATELSLYTIDTFGDVITSYHGDQGSPSNILLAR